MVPIGTPKLAERRKAEQLRKKGLSNSEVAREIGVAQSTVHRWLGPGPRKGGRFGAGTIPVAPIREAFLRSGMTPIELAIILDWQENKLGGTFVDGFRVKKVLGLAKYTPGRGMPPRYREHVTERMAFELCIALNLDFREYGL